MAQCVVVTYYANVKKYIVIKIGNTAEQITDVRINEQEFRDLEHLVYWKLLDYAIENEHKRNIDK